MKIPTFEQFLEDTWFQHFSEGQTKEGSEAACERWIEGLDVGEMIEWGQRYGDYIQMQLEPKEV